MRKKSIVALLIMTAFFTVSCVTSGVKKNVNIDRPDSGDNKNIEVDPAFNVDLNGDYNFKFVAVDSDVTNPDNDKRSYYRVFIDKIDSGRTAIGLESQNKVFEKKLTPNRHLLSVEKYVLNEKKGKYVKLNNIFQPKPSFYYFNIKADSVVVVKLEQTQKDGRAKFIVRSVEK